MENTGRWQIYLPYQTFWPTLAFNNNGMVINNMFQITKTILKTRFFLNGNFTFMFQTIKISSTIHSERITK